MSKWNYLQLNIGILDSLLRQWNGFEDFNISKFCTILLKFAIVFKIFKYFCIFLSLTIVTDQQNFSSLADGLLDITPETKKIRTFSLQNLESFLLKFAIFGKFLKIRFLFDLFTNKARKLKVAESNQANASLTKPWLATFEANRLPVVWEQFAQRCNFVST